MAEQTSGAASTGVGLGVLLIGSGLVLQTLPFVLSGAVVDAVGYYLVVLFIAVLLLLPVRPSRWPITTRRAAAVGGAWLLVGLPAPLWLITVQLMLFTTLPAGVLALLGAGVACLRSPAAKDEPSA